MMVSAEGSLGLLIVGLFLKLSLLLLRQDEAVLIRRLGGGWGAGFAAKHWRWAGREPYLANPFMPHEPVVRLKWQLAPPNEASSGRSTLVLPHDVIDLGAFAWLTWLLLFVLLPVTLAGKVPFISTAHALGLLYVNIIASLVATWLARPRLGFDSKKFAVLAFECVVCPPYAANLVRRVTSLVTVDEDFASAAGRLLQSEQLNYVKRECLARIDERIEAEPEESSSGVLLKKGRLRFVVKDSDEHE